MFSMPIPTFRVLFAARDGDPEAAVQPIRGPVVDLARRGFGLAEARDADGRRTGNMVGRRSAAAAMTP